MTATPEWPDNIWVIGCGNMGGAILQAWLDLGLPQGNLSVVTASGRRLDNGIQTRDHLPETGSPDLVLFAVKPHMVDDVAPELAPRLGPASCLVSILAGTELEILRDRFPAADTIVRVMPNMAVTLGKSPMVMIAENDDAALKDRMNVLFAPLGPPEWLENEDQMHLATALSGSGPAFLFRFIDALASGAKQLGMPQDQAARLAIAMVEGAAELAARSDHDPGTLANQVASPNGVTRKGLDVMDADGRANILMQDVLKAAMERNIEMAEEARK
ncbi:pyrroline-5-carboxylate reductase [Parasphingorhabdus sp.]|uniref:pyrroline-5-carboxylate reductase n=1 Tax=Parasphingorhabdus sp. TaxID=2709688 RepID=UPI0032632786